LRGGPGCSPLAPGPSPTPRNLRFRGDHGTALLACALLMRLLRCSAARAHSDHLATRFLGRVSGRHLDNAQLPAAVVDAAHPAGPGPTGPRLAATGEPGGDGPAV